MNVGAMLKSCSYGLKYVIGRRLFGKTTPLIRGLVLTNRCNLRCRHCRVDARGPMDLGFAEVVAAIDAFHREGGRSLYLEGGEPFLWHDGQRGLDDVVEYAHGLGFLTVVVYTNGSFSIRTSAARSSTFIRRTMGRTNSTSSPSKGDASSGSYWKCGRTTES